MLTPAIKRVPLGKPLTAEQLLAEIGDGSDPTKLEPAKESWRQNAPKVFKNLLDAKEES